MTSIPIFAQQIVNLSMEAWGGVGGEAYETMSDITFHSTIHQQGNTGALRENLTSHLSVYLPTYPHTYLPTHLPTYLPIYPSIHLSVSLCKYLFSLW